MNRDRVILQQVCYKVNESCSRARTSNSHALVTRNISNSKHRLTVFFYKFSQALKVYNKKYPIEELRQNPPPEGVDPRFKEVSD